MPELTNEQRQKLNQSTTAQSNGGKSQIQVPTAQSSPADAQAIQLMQKTAAGSIRQAAGISNQFVEKLDEQVGLVASNAGERVATILNPQNIMARVAVETLNALEGQEFAPLELEAIELPPVQRYLPQLPASYASVESDSSSGSTQPAIDASASETTCGGNSRTAQPKGFGKPRS